MLPLLQRHHAVQPSANLEPLPPVASQIAHDFNCFSSRLPRNAVSSALRSSRNQRAVPIRTSQPASPLSRTAVSRTVAGRPVPHIPDLSDHRLRRKTPNGTIDGGYDGSPTQVALGQPPLKQMIVPPPSGHSSANTDNALLGNAFVSSITPSKVTGSGRPRNKDWCLEAGEGRSRVHVPYAAGCPGRLPGDPLLDQGQPPQPIGDALTISSVEQISMTDGAAFRQPKRAAAFRPEAFGSPSPIDGHYYGQSAFRQQQHRQNVHHPDIPRARPSDLWIPSSTAHMHKVSPNPGVLSDLPSSQNAHDSIDICAPTHFDVGQSPPGLDRLSLDPERLRDEMGNPVDTTSRSRFREKALAYAHKSYVDLLAHLHHSGNLQNPTSTEHSTPKVIVYPRPPKHIVIGRRHSMRRTEHLPPEDQDTKRPAVGIADAASIKFLATPQMLGTCQSASVPQELEKGLRFAAPLSLSSSSSSRQPSAHKAYYSTLYPLKERDPNWPISGAKLSLEMLNHLCEQGDWKWIDGMLLGGCLHYGLEHFEKALDWFSRIVAIDSRYANSTLE